MATLTASRQPLTILLERVLSPPGRVDRQAGVLRNVKILGRVSKNGYEYTDQAMRQCAALYEGINCYADHDRKNPDRERQVSEWAGTLRNVRVAVDGVFGDLHLRKNSKHYNGLMEAAEHFPRQFGLSHNARGTNPVSRGGKRFIESVRFVLSVDIVTRPATTVGLFESVKSGSCTQNNYVPLFQSGRRSVSRQTSRLTEEIAADVIMADAPNAMAHESLVDERLKAAFRSAVASAFDDGSLDSNAKLAKIKEILNIYNKLKDRDSKTADKKKSGKDSDDLRGYVQESASGSYAPLFRKPRTQSASRRSSYVPLKSRG